MGSAREQAAAASARERRPVPDLARVCQRQSTSIGAEASRSQRQQEQPAAAHVSQCQPVPAGGIQPASPPGEPDRQTDRDQVAREPSRQLGRQTAASRIASQLIRQVGSHVAAAAGLQQDVFFGALLCSTSPPAETRLTVYRRSQHRAWLAGE